jgi:predicted enzyme related to lactoylglutathione lyase
VKIVEIAFVGYPVTDLQRARKFYEEVLGLKVTHIFGNDEFAWVEYDIGPGTLAIGNGSPEWKPSAYGGCAGLEVEDFDAAINRLREHNISFTREPFETPVCSMAIVNDPDGNSILIHKRKAGHT